MLKNLFFLLLLPCFLNAQNLIKNGDFEKGNIDFKSQYKFTTAIIAVFLASREFVLTLKINISLFKIAVFYQILSVQKAREKE